MQVNLHHRQNKVVSNVLRGHISETDSDSGVLRMFIFFKKLDETCVGLLDQRFN